MIESDGSPTSRKISLGSVVCLPDSATAKQLCHRFHQYAHGIGRCPDCSELHQQSVDAVLRPTFVQKLCYKLPSVVTFTFIQICDQNFVFFTKQPATWVSLSIRTCRWRLTSRELSRAALAPYDSSAVSDDKYRPLSSSR